MVIGDLVREEGIVATEETIRTLLEKTQAAYRTCWRTIAGIKEMLVSPAFLQDLLQFQPTLAKALCDLDQEDRKLEQGREELVKQKARMPREQFLNEIRRLGHYQEAIREAVRLGKTLGDAFAWFFYRNDLPLLFKHLEHEPITEVPTGVGLDGELTFINNIKVVDGHLVLYHGITTILRHGDVSFIDLDTFKLTCLGELKSREMEGGELAVTVLFIGPRDRSLPAFFHDAPLSNKPSPPLPPDMTERLQRQLQGMAAAFKPIPAREELKYEQDTLFPVLMKLADELEQSEVVYEQCGDGLLLAGFRTDETTSLFDKLLNSKTDAVKKVQNLGPHVEKLIDKSQPNAADNANSLAINALGRGALPGTTPLFWCPLKLSFLEKLFFQDAVVVTIYNPAHLIRKLRDQGFQARPLGNRRYEVYKMVGEKRMSLEGFDYFQRLIQDHLVDEDVVLGILSHAHSLIVSGKVGVNTRIPFYFSQQFQVHISVFFPLDYRKSRKQKRKPSLTVPSAPSRPRSAAYSQLWVLLFDNLFPFVRYLPAFPPDSPQWHQQPSQGAGAPAASPAGLDRIVHGRTHICWDLPERRL
jgi:hypothetical protein